MSSHAENISLNLNNGVRQISLDLNLESNRNQIDADSAGFWTAEIFPTLISLNEADG